jgi:hypothetical protein
MREAWARPPASGRRADQAGWLSRATDPLNPTRSRAIAVQTTVSFLPRADSARYRAVRRLGAVQAISRTLGGTCASLYSLALPMRGGCR